MVISRNFAPACAGGFHFMNRDLLSASYVKTIKSFMTVSLLICLFYGIIMFDSLVMAEFQENA